MVRVSSPPQSQSKAVVCFSTPRMYPRSGYLLVIQKIEFWTELLPLSKDHFQIAKKYLYNLILSSPKYCRHDSTFIYHWCYCIKCQFTVNGISLECDIYFWRLCVYTFVDWYVLQNKILIPTYTNVFHNLWQVKNHQIQIFLDNVCQQGSHNKIHF